MRHLLLVLFLLILISGCKVPNMQDDIWYCPPSCYVNIKFHTFHWGENYLDMSSNCDCDVVFKRDWIGLYKMKANQSKVAWVTDTTYLTFFVNSKPILDTVFYPFPDRYEHNYLQIWDSIGYLTEEDRIKYGLDKN